MIKNQITKIVFSSIDQINLSLEKANKLEKNLDETIIGESSKIDSIVFLNLILDIESKLLSHFNEELNIFEHLTNDLKENYTLNDLIKLINLKIRK